ncbi:hypothetical protein H2204_006751 [Knufia peltigerae]|uniref:Uncharacterized protein n=1 Tax=Knufia peltigerae TaxID=1002370 RepID=A0AA38Y4I0_9EURO|nr:hypothetical protein H2204_006751 [Knufia peltigerae]
MGFWPFGGRKNARASQPHLQRPHTFGEKEEKDLKARPGSDRAEEMGNMARNQTHRGPDDKPRRLSKQRLPKNVSRVQTAPVSGPGSETWNGRRSSAVEPSALHGQKVYAQDPTSQMSIGPEDFTALPQAPTLLARRGTYDPTLTRRKSSKRKAEDYAREREIRAMSSPDYRLKRPASYSGSGPLRRDTQNVPGDLNRRLQRPNSKVSLPLPEVIQDAEDFENQGSFKVGILAALAPRPTLTYVSHPRSSTGKQPARIRPSVQEAIEEEAPASRKRIDELADDLDAGALRELMDRDRRRHERKKAADRERLQRKLQRKADRQREEELRGYPVAASPTGPADLGTEAEEQRGRRLRNASAGSSEFAATAAPPIGRERAADPFKDPSPEHKFDTSQTRPANRIRNPFEDEKDVDIMQDPFDHEEDEGSVVPVRSPLRTISPLNAKINQQPLQATTISPPTSPVHRPSDLQNLSQTSVLARETAPDVADHGSAGRRASDQSSQQQQLSSWTSFFRRGTRRKPSAADRGRSTPSEFSNTSRESFARKQQPPPVVVPRTFRKSDSSGVPQRTMSKFREDLPEFPISPPDSRVQSPEAMSTAQAIAGQHTVRPSHSGTLDGMSLATTSSNPALEGQQLRSAESEASAAPVSGHMLSQSLASVDSEGSWLSGKPAKRMSGGLSHPLRQSVSSIPPNAVPGSFETEEEEELAQDEYFTRLNPEPGARRDSVGSAGRRASSNVIDLERERQHSPIPDVPPVPTIQGGDETWHAGLGRQATVVRQATRAKSSEGLLKEYGAESSDGSRRSSSDGDDEASDGELLETVTPGTELAGVPILRARSVEYKGGHARHISAGSAKLLDIRRTSSVSQASTAQRSPGLPQKKTMIQHRSQSPPRQP